MFIKVCYLFKELEDEKGNFQEDRTKYETDNILYSMIRFYHAYNEFKNNTVMFYFDYPSAETFLAELRTKILEAYKQAIKEEDIEHLKDFAKSERYDCKRSSEFKRYSTTLCKYLEIETVDELLKYLGITEIHEPFLKPRQKFYALHLVFSNVLLICINEGFLGTYSSTTELQKDITFTVREHAALKSYTEYINSIIYKEKNKERYYEIKFNNKSLLR